MIPLWLDCDPGHDDAIALLLACALPYFQLIGVSTVFGNAGLDATTNNALSLLTAFHRHQTAVFPGAEKPLMGFLHTAASIHGKSGLDGTALLPMPMSTRQPDHTAVQAIAEAIEMAQGELALVATGPLTNIALLVMHYPELLKDIKYLSIMGGGVEMGNWTQAAEFNIWSDPEAARVVLTCPELAGRIVLVPINLTHQVIATADVLQSVQHGPKFDKYTVFRQMMYELLTYFATTYKRKFGFKDGPPVHDPLAVAVLLALYDDPDFPDMGFDAYKANVTVDTEGPTAGKLTVDPTSDGAVYIVNKINPQMLWDLVYESIAVLENS